MRPDTTEISRHTDHRMYKRNIHLIILSISFIYRQTDPLQ